MFTYTQRCPLDFYVCSLQIVRTISICISCFLYFLKLENMMCKHSKYILDVWCKQVHFAIN